MPSTKKGRGKKQRKAPSVSSTSSASASTSDEQLTGKTCNGCGQPPHRGKDLLNCNRCKNAWYHDEKCQRAHFPTHKSQCKKAEENTASSSKAEAKKCYGCGLPARGEKWMYCSKCDEACYHGRECQLKHFEDHKKDCKKIAARNANFRPMEGDCVTMSDLLGTLSAKDDENVGVNYYPPPLGEEMDLSEMMCHLTTDDESPPFVKVEVREGRRCVVATENLDVGENPFKDHICDCGGDHGWSESLVPPVVLDKYRWSCCTVCFSPFLGVASLALEHAHLINGVVHVWCSDKCREGDPNGKVESSANSILFKRGQEMPFADTILMARVIRYSAKYPEVKKDFDQLHCNVEAMTDDEKSLELYKLTTCHEYLKLMGGSIGKASSKWLDKFYETPYEDELFVFEEDIAWAVKFEQNMQIISTEQTKGFGIFPQASLISHSCEPNAVTTFMIRPNQYPVMQITTLSSVAKGEELTIDYIRRDWSSVSHTSTAIRHKRLWAKHKLTCSCNLCLDFSRDDIHVGLLCPTRGCKGTVKSQPVKMDGESEIKSDRTYMCDTCGHDDFRKLFRWVDAILRKCNESGESPKAHKDCLLRSYELAKKDFHRQSWIVATLAAEFVKACAKNFCTEKGIEKATVAERKKRCRQIIDVMWYSRDAMELCIKGRHDWPYLKLFEAQARLHIHPYDSEALHDVHAAQKEIYLFLPKTEEFLVHPFEFGQILVPKRHCGCNNCVEKPGTE